MKQEKLLQRIEINPDVMVGKPVIKGTRLSVQFILGLLAQGEKPEEIINEYPGLLKDDIKACLMFSFKVLEETIFYPLQKTPAV
ncbi:MAG: DUF433 domain-containing protein [Bacteroidia bacterium]|nr:DUF433 domain-containing protein [Bacteroidia bacterium]